MVITARTRNAVAPNGARGFESHLLRHIVSEKSDFIGLFSIFMAVFRCLFPQAQKTGCYHPCIAATNPSTPAKWIARFRLYARKLSPSSVEAFSLHLHNR